ncbi:MAG TPA: LacI family DNA-binding transcriptional regulator [Chloroflexota bacterium]|nr:LacI family DNA-binding transcriptional regulator [Chloroflexota bacterium]
MSPTIRDVASLAGVSVASASRVLGGSSHPVAEETRRRVLQAARQLDFTPNAFARGLSKRECHLVGLVIPNIREPYFIEIARGTEDAIIRQGYMVVLCNTDREQEKERRYVEELRAMRAGIILVGRAIYGEAHLADLASHPAPVVVVGRHQLPCATILVDNVQGGLDATSHLIACGYRRIAFIGGPAISSTANDRLAGYRQAMERYGLPIDPTLMVESDFSLEGGARGIVPLLQSPNRPEALFAANDQMAIGAMREARRFGLRIPEDLSVVGFNDVPMAAFADPPLTTIHLPLHRIGEIAAELLLRQLQSQNWENSSVRIRGDLVIRDSTVPCK